MTFSSQLELSFKVEDQEGNPINGATIKIQKINEDGSMENVAITEEGVVAGKFKEGTSFKVMEVSKEGYELVTDLTQEIIIDARQSENIIPLVLSIKKVSIIMIMINLERSEKCNLDFFFSLY